MTEFNDDLIGRIGLFRGWSDAQIDHKKAPAM